MYSNAYIFRYAGIMVILVAAVLSAAAMLLKPMQERNEAVDKMTSILKAAGFEDVNAKNAIDLFNSTITNMIVINQDGEVVDDFTGAGKEKSKAFGLNLKEQLYNKSMKRPFELPIFKANKNGETIYIIPMRGVGLWGPVWGNIALRDDFNTVIGVTFDHKSETPGLGAEITTPIFTDQFPGKTLFDDNGKFVSIKVVKGGAANLDASMRNHAVDAISGGTITSNGVSDMIRNVLESYEPYIKKIG
ncbi:MAG: NADH:ubiquinone reductase (Na(+)-transporting) subunit C [Bacteroidia bacterium]|jgi:Na+-transporting NADH:ubiquinone oxidoreductase subunit C|nr:NADH:ubiquinone reductase (Na(+)-transporting) subunit C [Bacteroidia bacterium]